MRTQMQTQRQVEKQEVSFDNVCCCPKIKIQATQKADSNTDKTGEVKSKRQKRNTKSKVQTRTKLKGTQAGLQQIQGQRASGTKQRHKEQNRNRERRRHGTDVGKQNENK